MKKIFYFAIIATLAFIGCSKNDDISELKGEQFSITATIGDVQTRTSYTDQTADANKGLKVAWEENETISVIELDYQKKWQAVYQFTSNNAAGETATFTAPAEFNKKDDCYYVAVYPALQSTGWTGDNETHYYSGAAANLTTIELRGASGDGLFRMGSSFLAGNNRIFQIAANDANHLKNYDAMVSAVEFNGSTANINLTKLNAVIKWDLQLPAEAVGTTIKQVVLSSTNGAIYYSATLDFSNLLEGKTWWSVGNSAARYSMSLGNITGTTGFTVPEGGKVSIYMPVYGSKSGQSEMCKLSSDVDYTISIDGKYSATASPTSDILLEQGKVYVFTATLSK